MRRAIDLAVDLARAPALAGVMRQQALPPDILDVIRLAAGCPEASKAAVAATRQPIELLRTAAIFYLEQMLFFPDAGLHRNLGVGPGASRAEMRLHMRWLMQWLHPDHNSSETAALLAQRVIQAWHELGRRDHAAAHVARPPALRRASSNPPKRRPKMRVRWIPVPLETAPPAPRRRWRTAVLILGIAGAFALIFIPVAVASGWRSLFGTKVVTASAAAPHSGGASRDGVRRR